jgi:hypothetical protein
MKINLWWTLATQVALNLLVLLNLANLPQGGSLALVETLALSLGVVITAGLITRVENLEKSGKNERQNKEGG